ncbi:MAG TPA: hypothetical protein VMV00_02425 [Candidatus Baltobacteraceae bacterium]|nr:hypothetical protein [Candidatus Baltobacteraceae bacterium]
MAILKIDERCRVTIGKKAVARYGKRFWMLDTPDGIVLVPVPKDPIKELEALGKRSGIGRYTMEEVKKIIEAEAKKEALRGLK